MSGLYFSVWWIFIFVPNPHLSWRLHCTFRATSSITLQFSPSIGWKQRKKRTAPLCPRAHCVLLWRPAGRFEMISHFMILLFTKAHGRSSRGPTLSHERRSAAAPGSVLARVNREPGGDVGIKRVLSCACRGKDRGRDNGGGGRSSVTWQRTIHLD